MDPDPGGPKTCGSGGSGFGSATLVKSTIILGVLAKENFLYLFKNQIFYNFMIFVATKNDRTKFSLSFFGAVVGSGIRDPGWIKISIRDPG
jgi:hypothetical protein